MALNSIQFKIDYKQTKDLQSNLRETLTEMKKGLAKAVGDSTTTVFNEITRQTPVRKQKGGRLLSGNRISVQGFRGRIWNPVFYAAFVHEGTGIYGPRHSPIIIRPKKKKALKFKVNGKWIIVKKVVNPGQRPNPFYTRSMENTRKQVEEIMGKFGSSIIFKVKGNRI